MSYSKVKNFDDKPIRGPVIFDLQRFAGDGDGGAGDGGTGDGGNSGGSGGDQGFQFSGKFIEKVDPETKKAIKIPVELEPMIGHFISATRKSVESQFKPLVEKIENENTELKDIQVEYEKLKELSMTAEERAQENAKKKIQEHEKAMRIATEEAAVWKERFVQSTIRNDVLSSFGDTKLFNPMQVALLFQNEGEAKISEIVDDEGKPTGKYETRMTLILEDDKGEPEKAEGTPSELFKKWIQLDRNLHHVQNDVSPGGGAGMRSSTGGRMSGKIDPKLPPVERMKQFREQQATGK